MMPRLGEKYEIELEIISKPKAEYLTDEYFSLDLPVAPAIMVGDEIVTEGKDIDDHSVEVVICKQLGLSEPVGEKKSFINKILGG
jgi:hypothetical protein